jgi:hypothetical protein
MSSAAPKQPVSVFNQAAEDRLKELLEKRKRDKLTRAEALEVRELQLLKAAAELAKKRAAIEQARRQLADQDRYRIGGFALTAGLGGWSEAELQAGFAFLAAMDAAQRAALPPVAANADSKAGGDAVAAPVTSATASATAPAPTPEAEEAPPAQAQAEPMAEAAMPIAASMPASASMSHEPPPVRRLGRLM